jgi:polysaccharide biosynthesis protein PslA
MRQATMGTVNAGLPRAAFAPAWLAWARLELFRVLILALEAGCVLASGALIQAALAGMAGMANPIAMAAAYLGVTLLAGTLVDLPDKREQGAAIRALGVLFVVGTTLLAPSLAAVVASLLWFVVALGGVMIIRNVAVRVAERSLTLSPRPRPVAFIGNSEAAARMLRQIEADPHHRATPVGFFDDRISRPGPLNGKLPCLGHIDELASYLTDHELHDVYMALPWSAGERISELIHRLRFLPLTVRLLPDQTPPALRPYEAEQLGGVVLPTLMLPPFSAVGAILKRGCDLAICALLAIPLGFLFAVVAIVIKIDSRGPVFFRQARSGQYGRSFDIYKFRSLHVAQTDSAAETLVSRGDKRVTRVGWYLRKYSIDELPQILNVVLGQMSLVGPRPHAPRAKADGRIYAEVMPDYMLRYRVKPGMTGWAQVNGWRGNTDTEEKLRKRVEFDFAYIRSWSMRRDFEILLRTIPSVLAPPPGNA